LATDSLRIEKVQENGLFRLSGVFLGLGQVIQPANIQGHSDSLLWWGLGPGPARLLDKT
jgi:hypothetical protein